MASPHVAGTAALLIRGGIADTNGNGRINDEVRSTLTSTSQDLGAPGLDNLYGFGLVDAAAAVATVGPPAPSVIVDLTTDKLTYTTETDTEAVIAAAVTDEEGTAITGLTAGAFVTILDGSAPIFATPFTETATVGTYTASIDISTLAEDTHTIEVTATDSRGLSGDGQAAFVVAPEPPPADPQVTVTGGGSAEEAGEVSASFQVDLDQTAGDDLVVTYSVSGSATAGEDYESLSGSVTILAGSTSESIEIIPIDDAEVESNEVVILTLTAGSGYDVGQPGLATITITSDDDPADLTVSSASGPSTVAAGTSIDVSDTTTNQGAGPAAESTTTWSIPGTWVTDYSGDIGNTFGLNGFSIGSSRQVSSSK